MRVIRRHRACSATGYLLAAATFKTINQMASFQNISSIGLSGFGGAIIPLDDLPDWAQSVAPFTPTYWAMDGYRTILLDGGTFMDVLGPASVLLASTLVLGTIASMRFKVDESKQSYL